MELRQLPSLSIADLSRALRAQEITVREVIEATVDRIRAINPKINAYITVREKQARAAAAKADEELRAGKIRSPLHGVPVAVKDLFALRDTRTTAGSKVLANHTAGYDASAIMRLEEAGAILVGTLNLHEFAYGATNEESLVGACRNPWNLERVSGGSSGGSGAAVAAGLCHGALGTDTGGSIRVPASFCGVVGMKATYGRVSRHGVIPLSWSLDHIGPLTRTVRDAALLLQVIAGYDPHDPASANRPVPNFEGALQENVEGVRAGVLTKYFEETFDDGVRRLVQSAIHDLERVGLQVQELAISNLEYTATVTNMLMACEATAVHEKWLQTRADEYQPSVRVRLEGGFFYSALDYLKAQRLRRWFRRRFADALRKVDVILSPTMPYTAWPIGVKTMHLGGTEQDPRLYLAQFTRIHNLSGFPAITVPCGFGSDGLPVGLQVSGRPFDEETVLRVAHAYEQRHPWKDRLPPV